MSNSYEIIKQAILDKTAISANYKGYYRELAPHAIGTKQGKQQALFYQFGGESSSGLIPNSKDNWRCLTLDQLTNVQVIDKQWQTHNNHSSPSSCIDIIDVEVAY